MPLARRSGRDFRPPPSTSTWTGCSLRTGSGRHVIDEVKLSYRDVGTSHFPNTATSRIQKFNVTEVIG